MSTLKEQQITCAKGSGRIWSPARAVFSSEVIGIVDARFAEAYIAFGNALLAAYPKVTGLHDWSMMQGYEPGVRATVTAWAIKVISSFDEIHILTHSSMVKMGVSVANIPLRGKVRVHEDRAAFERARDVLLAARGES